MYSYEEFKAAFEEKFMAQAGEDERERVRFSTINKPYGEMDGVGLCCSIEGNYKGGPCLYLNEAYKHYQEGGSIEDEVDSVWKTLRRASVSEFKLPDFSWEYVKERLVLQLVNKENNESFFEGVPHREYLDLAMVYRVMINENAGNLTSCVVTNGLMATMGVTEEELFQAAYHKTPLILMPRVYSMYEVLREMNNRIHEIRKEEIDSILEAVLFCSMQVVSDTAKQMGAYLLAYPEFFRGIANGEDLYIIPSSVHELIIMPAAGSDTVESITQMIHEVNTHEVMAEEVLSDTLYRYDAKANRVVIA